MVYSLNYVFLRQYLLLLLSLYFDKIGLLNFLFSEVELAISSLNGRYFGGRVVRAEKYDQDMFDANDLSG